ncbi:MAG: biotin--[acetyl-CoA-carboxylase] ligase [Chlorobi bacterium]|nr:biotin--[acetyl-CoA-carboxylase] ligase [Chlorobiota bacterium]
MFNIEEFDIKCNTEIIGRNFIYLDEIDSTNSFLLNKSEYNEHGTIVLTEYQSAGKGRLDREWVSTKEENLLFSILINEDIDAENVNLIVLGSSLAVAQSIENLFQLPVEIKWPNDILIAGKKVSGILLESSSKGNVIEKVVIGFGINVNQTSFEGQYGIRPTSIRLEAGHPVSRERLLSEILNNFEEVLTQIFSDSSKVLNDWKSRCKMLGERIKISDGENTKTGIFEDVDEMGFLLLRTQSGLEKILFGDVSLRT